MSQSATLGSRNIIVGNAAGTFSTMLKYFAWLSVAERPDNNLRLEFDFRNKTHGPGNTLFNYGSSRNFQELTRDGNLFSRLFTYKDCAPQPFPTNDAIYVESYPKNYAGDFRRYPDILKTYHGKGNQVDQYFDAPSMETLRRDFHRQWKKFSLAEGFSENVENQLAFLPKTKTLAVMLRCSAHYHGLFDMEDIVREATAALDENGCDNLLVLTQIEPFLEKLIARFGNRCLFPDRARRKADEDWSGATHVMTDREFLKETEECLIDVIAASRCRKALAGASNMLLGALCFNPSLEYGIFDSLSQRNGA